MGKKPKLFEERRCHFLGLMQPKWHSGFTFSYGPCAPRPRLHTRRAPPLVLPAPQQNGFRRGTEVFWGLLGSSGFLSTKLLFLVHLGTLVLGLMLPMLNQEKRYCCEVGHLIE